MQSPSRRRLLRFAAASAAASAQQAWPAAIRKALALSPRAGTGSLDDVQHVVVLMQENRSFDHYFGTLRGVRGFGDPRPERLPGGAPVWAQPAEGGAQQPFRPDVPGLGLRFLEGTPHDWATTQKASNGGRHDGWIAAKGRASMAYLTRRDIPFHHALADAFTICDAYHCSLLGPTDPNRYHLWTGWTGNDGSGGGPVVTNAEAGYGWTTFPERLERAGIDWKIYQDEGLGLDAAGAWGCTQDATIGNYGDNSLLYFNAYRNARPGDPLFERARRGTRIASRPGERLLDDLRADIGAGCLPQVSWIVAPEAYSEHPNWPPNFGAWYIAQVLDALTADPEVWARTALFITYDENDGFFDHVIPPTPPTDAALGRSTVDVALDRYAGDAANPAGPYGLGMRVPMIVVSPWTRGGWVCSEVFDHTSILRFIERRFSRPGAPLREVNITPWRRAICGDMTSAFDFASSVPQHEAAAPLPPTFAYTPADRARHPDFKLTDFAASGALPHQEPGVRRARALPYDFDVRGEAVGANWKNWQFTFTNRGRAGAHFRVSSPAGEAPRGYTVEAGKTLNDAHAASDGYDWIVTAPGSFHREFAGAFSAPEAHVHGVAAAGGEPQLLLTLHNPGDATIELHLAAPLYREIAHRSIHLRAHETRALTVPLHATHGWYDLLVTQPAAPHYRRRLAGQVQTGQPSVSDPALGR